MGSDSLLRPDSHSHSSPSSWSHTIRLDPRSFTLNSESPGQSDDSGFGSGVVRLPHRSIYSLVSCISIEDD
jgi:hypothetical protein